MAKDKKIDVRLTEELDQWITEEANKRTLSRSSFARMLLEDERRRAQQTIQEPSAPYNQTEEKRVS